AGGLVVVVARHRVAGRLHPAPARVVRLLELRGGPALVLVVAERQHRGIPLVDQQVRRRALPAGGRRAGAAVVRRVGGVAGDVAGGRDDRVTGRGDGGGRGHEAGEARRRDSSGEYALHL